MTNKPKYHITVTGCQMNKSDAERLAAVAEHLGYQPAKKIESADLVIFVACSVRQTAIDRLWGFASNLKKNKRIKPVTTILTGCLLPKDKSALEKCFDFVFDIKDMIKLEEFLHKKQTVNDDYLEILPCYSNPFQAFVPIMTGCDNFCSYCAVPYARGREVSRSVKAVLTEIKKLAKNGCLEITLLGQNVNSYAPADVKSFNAKNPFKHNFAKLLWEVNQIQGLKRINFVAAHPKDMADEVIESLTLPKMMNYLHLALQSGDNEILKKMNRKYTVEDYWKIIEKVRKLKPEMAIGTDLIVGFPGETKKQFDNTLKIFKKIKFDIAYQSKYSPRTGTAAAKLVDDIPIDEKKRRWRAIQDLMVATTLSLNQKFLNQTVSVLVDTYKNNYCEGNSSEMKRVKFKSPKKYLGQIVDVKITKPMAWLLLGKRKTP
jgi:tRNA-2-methylthio-N6-dimethylallyladenosine synthase